MSGIIKMLIGITDHLIPVMSGYQRGALPGCSVVGIPAVGITSMKSTKWDGDADIAMIRQRSTEATTGILISYLTGNVVQ